MDLWEEIELALEKAMGEPLQFLLYTIAVFGIIILIGAFFVYKVVAYKNKSSQMQGLMRIGVTLNADSSDPFHYGQYLVSMQDPQKLTEERLDPKLSILEKASCREYPLWILLKRFHSSFLHSGFEKDPSCALLGGLLEDDSFRDELGVLCRKNRKQGLRLTGLAQYTQDLANRDKLSILRNISGGTVETFENEIGCEVYNIRIELEYLDNHRWYN